MAIDGIDLKDFTSACLVIAGHDAGPVLASLLEGNLSYKEISQQFDGENAYIPGFLSQLTQFGLIERFATAGPPFRVHYGLTDSGRGVAMAHHALKSRVHADSQIRKS